MSELHRKRTELYLVMLVVYQTFLYTLESHRCKVMSMLVDSRVLAFYETLK